MKPTRIIEGQWSIIHQLDMKPMLEHKNRLIDTVNKAMSENNPWLGEAKHIYHRINIILDHICEICNHLNIQTRVKRGLINGLGSVIKSITGNLDQDDLNNIQKDLETLKVAYNKQISVTDESLEEYNKQIKKIVNIQNLLDKQNVQSSNQQSQQRYAMDILLQVQTLQDIAERLSTAITFAEHHMYHYSIIQSHVLQDTLSCISKDIVISNNINDIEPLIDVSCRILDNIVYFIIQIPLVKVNSYKTRKIVPIIQNLPSCTYPIMRKITIAYNEKETYEVEDCFELKELICKGTVLQRNICETDFLSTKSTEKCQTVQIRCPEEEIQVISPKAIYVYLNKTTEVKINCGKRDETLWIKGSYLLSGENCELSIAGVKRFRTMASKEKIIITSLEINKTTEAVELDLTYDPDKITSKLKQLQQIQGLQTQETHNFIQYGLITSIILSVMGVLVYKFLRSKVCSKPWTPKLGEDSQIGQTRESTKNIISIIDPGNNMQMETMGNKSAMHHYSPAHQLILAPWTSKYERRQFQDNNAIEIL